MLLIRVPGAHRECRIVEAIRLAKRPNFAMRDRHRVLWVARVKAGAIGAYLQGSRANTNEAPK